MAARPLLERQTNHRLEALIEEAGFSNASLARSVNSRGEKLGISLRYDKTSVSRWLRGQRPRARTAAIIAEVLSERLDRTVSLEEIGMAFGRNLAGAVGLQFASDIRGVVEQACSLWASDADPRGVFFGSAIAASALIGPSRDWLITPPDTKVARSGGSRVGDGDVAAVNAATHALSDLDQRFGSGHLRSIVVHYLNTFVSGLLTGSYDESTGRALFGAVARLNYLAAYMAVDTGLLSLAQRYYVQALRLSQVAGDRLLGGCVLACGMGHLAPALGHPREVVQLALAARGGAEREETPMSRALFLAAEARGYALLRDNEACEVAIGRAIEALEQAKPGTEPEWLHYFDMAYLAGEFAHCYRDLGQPELSAHWAERAHAEHPELAVRRRVIDLLLLASARIELDEVEEGRSAATRAIELLSGVRSSICAEYVRDFQRLLHQKGLRSTLGDFREQLESCRTATSR
ncbi:transcriptional regulator [Streptomyces sp. 8K308]|uniref:transcriptional regulator n=1 Tax=Streptomyces sp. 8K308 TaxID=2530388 RepID=UPI0010499B16|nr:transcriptional regulator [Streptomyces sp. 8K308]TDC24918.1 transcriptional regulator [Streptomyces sp. 8K308]